MEFIKYEEQERIGVLTIHRPEAMNALHSGVLKEIDTLLDKLIASKSIRSLIVTGAGEKAFVAGADIKEIDGLSKTSAAEFASLGQSVFLKIENLFCPVIAAVNGFALGGGLELALACDFIFASEKAKLGLPECTLGLIPGFGGTVRLSRRVGPGFAKQWTYSGEMIKADKALASGLVNETFPSEELIPACMKQAQLMAERSPQSLKMIKSSISETYGVDSKSAMGIENKYFSELFETSDQKEGTRAFIEKRKPTFADL